MPLLAYCSRGADCEPGALTSIDLVVEEWVSGGGTNCASHDPLGEGFVAAIDSDDSSLRAPFCTFNERKTQVVGEKLCALSLQLIRSSPLVGFMISSNGVASSLTVLIDGEV
ncbi:hypothetical protein VNO78_00746 [Psophocarpus tetragonolobus]|uniref:Uncharacterized protein n=1 Tax=Psophocarpus tetragonolobus TaxID=3891 RepID=A0AAN9XV71_PSOTE